MTEIRNCPQEENVSEVHGETGYKHSIKSKYYEIDVVLLPHSPEKALSELDETILESIEGVIVYFDPSQVRESLSPFPKLKATKTFQLQREFLDKLETYATFLEDRGIELGLLLCQRVFDNSKDGITYKEAKKFNRLFDLVELSPDNPSEDEPQGGYDEVHVALRNTIWSNISMSGKKETKKATEMNEKEIEDKLADFEKLLTQAVNFRSNTSDLGRNERLLYAQQFADAFESIFGSESDDEEEEASGGSYQQLE